MKRLIRILPMVLFALVAVGCSKHQEKQPAARTTFGDEPMGEALFKERCRDCHRFHDKSAVGRDLSRIGSKPPRYLAQVIKEPAKLFPGTPMPPGDYLSAKQIDSLVQYLANFK